MLLYEKRDQIPAEYKWRLEDIVKDNQAWEELFFKVDERIGHFSKYADKLKDEDMLFDCLELETRLTHDITCLYQYAKMRLDQDTRDNTYQGMTNRAEMLIVKFSSAISFSFHWLQCLLQSTSVRQRTESSATAPTER